MTRFNRLGLLLAAVLALSLWPASAKADPPKARDILSGTEIRIESGQTVDEVIAVGGNVTVRGRVNGDVIVLAGNVTIEGGADVGGAVGVIAGQLAISPQARVRESIFHVDPMNLDVPRVLALLSGLTLL
ncbi:MAG: hypothetical protein ACYCSN_21020, partial [Acidobacteriaceae bacterium]